MRAPAWCVSLCMTVALAPLSGCARFGILAPLDGAILRTQGSTPVTLEAAPSLSRVRVQVDDQDVSQQFHDLGTQRSRGDLVLSDGQHTLTAEADVPCWYCTPTTWRASGRARVCVVPAASAETHSVTLHAKASGQVLRLASDSSVDLTADTGALATRWQLVSHGSINQSMGVIRSVENGCLCLRATDDQVATPIGLGLCDPGDHAQLWVALEQAPPGQQNFEFHNLAHFSLCLAVDQDHHLVQGSCAPNPRALWSVWSNWLGQWVPPF